MDRPSAPKSQGFRVQADVSLMCAGGYKVCGQKVSLEGRFLADRCKWLRWEQVISASTYLYTWYPARFLATRGPQTTGSLAILV